MILAHNIEEAITTYAGTPRGEKHLPGSDEHLLRHSQELKASVLPKTPQRIFIVHDSKGHQYRRLRLQYHLLPHNVYNYWRTPEARFVREGDYIILLERVPGVRHSHDQELLLVDGGNDIPAKQVYQSPMLTVFRVTGGRPAGGPS